MTGKGVGSVRFIGFDFNSQSVESEFTTTYPVGYRHIDTYYSVLVHLLVIHHHMVNCGQSLILLTQDNKPCYLPEVNRSAKRIPPHGPLSACVFVGQIDNCGIRGDDRACFFALVLGIAMKILIQIK